MSRILRSLFPLIICAILATEMNRAAAVPTILSQPQKAVVTAGSNHTFSVVADGAPPLQYQWFQDDVLLGGATAQDLVLTNVQTNNTGGYHAVISDVNGSATSIVARFVVRLPDDPMYATPAGGWTYAYNGGSVSNAGPSALDGTWNHDNGSDSWSGDGRGAGAGLPGGVSTTNGVVTIEDAIVSGTSSVDNRRYYFTHNLLQELAPPTADAILNNGVTLSFRARLTPPPPADPLTDLTNAPNGFVNVLDGKGMFGIRQAGANGMLISFSLSQALEDTSASATLNFGQPGLHMNNLNGDVRSSQVDPGDGGVMNVLPLDPTAFHEFWVTISENGTAPGTHRVSIYLDGNTTPAHFDVTAGSGLDAPYTNYIAIGLPSTGQRGAFDLDFFAYKAGVMVPAGLADPVQIVTPPTNQIVSAEQTATFSVGVIGTPPFDYQWYRNGILLPGETNGTYATAPATASDDGAQFFVTVSNLCGVATSAPPAVLTFLTPPTIISEPVDLVVTNGGTANFSVAATSSAAMAYQWRLNGAPLLNETNTVLAIAAVTPSHAGGYDAIVWNQAGSTTSRVAVLTVPFLDFGDAPAPYPTLQTNGGANHLVVNGIHLGNNVDFELDGTPESSAQGDDMTDSDDEDGVTFLSPLRAGELCMVEVSTSTQGVLNAWIDYDRNGNWLGAEEQIFTNLVLAAGVNQLTLGVPGTASGGETFARFRFGTALDLTSDGPAPDGEVEDYRLIVTPVADLQATMTVNPNPVAVGSNLVYAITVTNLGPSVATGVTLASTLPPEASFVAATPSAGVCVEIAGTLSCDFGNVPSGSGVTVSVTVAPNAAGLLTNVVSVSANEADLHLPNNSANTVTIVEIAPSIELQPVSLVVTQGNTTVFAITANGTVPLVYQWQFGGTNLPGETASSLTIADARPAHAGTYSVIVSNRVGTAQSQPVTLTVLTPPSILEPPVHSTNIAGSTATFRVTADGTAPLAYQWYFNDSAMEGAMSATLTLGNVQSTNAGNYQVAVANSAGSVTSAVARLTVIELDFGDAPDGPYPTLLVSDGARHRARPGIFLGGGFDIEADGQLSITAIGDDVNGVADEDGIIFRDALLVGQPAHLDVIASTNGILNAWLDFAGDGTWSDSADQIFTNVALVAGTNSLSFEISPFATSLTTFARFRFNTDGGLGFVGEASDGEVEDYAVRVGPAVQLSIALGVSPAITAVGSNVLYEITVTNHGPSAANSVIVTDQLPEAVTFVSAFPSVGSCTNENGLITCEFGILSASASATVLIIARAEVEGSIANSASVASTDHELFAGDNTATAVSEAYLYPAIVQQPVSQIVTNGGTATLNVIATGMALQYQWSVNGTNIAGATNASLVLVNAGPADEGAYVVAVSNAVGTVASGAAHVAVVLPPVIVTQPQDASVFAGSSASFTVGVQGTPPFSYQWFHHDIALAGETGATLFIANAQSSHDGVYTVVVSNAGGSAQSEPATLTVLVGPQIVAPPQSATNFAGSTAVFSVTVTGSEPLSYQWFFNETNLLLAANASVLALPNVQNSDVGVYHVVVTNIAGFSISPPAALSIAYADFGDAPDIGYPTLLNFNGAYHLIKPGVHLGSQIDSEGDGLPNAAASGDNAENLNDEDGVIFSQWLVGRTGRVQVVASTNGFLAAWVDFNRNGTWSEAGEHVLVSVAVIAGTNSLSIPVPTTAIDGPTYARFRFSTAPGLSLDGPAPDGEVEDYEVTINRAVDLLVLASSDPDPVLANSALIYTLIVTNRGPSDATAVRVNAILPSMAAFVSVVSSQGTCTNFGSVVDCDLGSLPVGQVATAVITIVPSQAGTITNRVSVSASEEDVDDLNNVTQEIATVVEPTAIYGSSLPIHIPDGAAADVYPATVFVSGVTATVAKVVVTLSNLTHVVPADLDVLLVGPGGHRVLLMSDAGTRPGILDATITFDDASTLALPETGRFVTETYRPTNFGSGDTFPAPAPGGPYASQLSAFRGTDPNGTWSLYILDDSPEEAGSLAGGWGISFLTLDRFADVRVTQIAVPSPVALGSNLIYHVTATNQGPADATGVRVTNILPPSVTLVSFSSTQGVCTNNGSTIDCVFGALTNGQSATLSVTVIPTLLGTITNEASVLADELDFITANNQSRGEVVVKLVNDLAVFGTVTPEPVLLSQQLTYTLVTSNAGPNPATAVVLTHELPPGLVFAGADLSQGAWTNDGSLVNCELGTINPGETVMIAVRANPVQVGDVTARTLVSAYEIDLAVADNEKLFNTTIGDVPTFILMPESQTVPVLLSANFTAAASGPEPIIYQWFVDGVPISGEMSPVLSIGSVRPSHAGTYSLVASNRFGAVTSSPAQLQIDYSGYRRATVELVSSSNLWRYNHDGLDLGAEWLRPEFDDAFWLQGQTLFGLEASEPYPYPDVIRTPLPLATPEEEFIVTFYFRTRFNFENTGVLLGLVSSNLVDDGAVLHLNGAHVGSVRLPPAPVSYSTFANAVVSEGTHDTLQLPTSSLREGTNVLAIEVHQSSPGSSDVVFGSTLSALTVPISDIVVRQSSGPSPVGVGSNLVLVTVVSNAGPASATDIDVRQSWTSAANFSAAISTHGSCAFDGTNVNCTIPSLAVGEIANVSVTILPQVSGSLTSAVSARAAELDLELANNSAFATVIVRDPPIIVVHPVSQTVTNGDLVLFNGTVTGAEPVLLQWFHAGVEIPGETNALLLIDAAQAADAGGYTLRASNDVGVAQGDAVLQVLVRPTISSIADQVADEDVAVGPVSFAINDFETPPANLQLLVTSSNPTLVPSANIQLGGMDAIRTMTLVPATNQSGTTTIEVTVRDADGISATETFEVTVNQVNDLPSISVVADASIAEDASLSTAITVDDVETLAEGLVVTAVSSNPSLVPDLNVLVTGSGATRDVQITPLPDQFGSSVIIFSATDGHGGVTSASLMLTVVAVNDPPQLSPIADITTEEDVAVTVEFTVSDIETAVEGLVLTLSSSNEALLPAADITIEGTNSARTLRLSPVQQQFGTAFVSVTVNDLAASNNLASISFNLSVNSSNDLPILSDIAAQEVNEDTATLPLPITIGDVETTATELVLSANTSDSDLIPVANVLFGGSGSNRTVTVLPATNRFGSAIVSVTVSDSDGGSNTDSFIVSVLAINDPPTLGPIANQVTREDVPAMAILDVQDPESSALSFAFVSSDASIVATNNIEVLNTGTNWLLKVMPTSNTWGSVTIGVVASDVEGSSATDSFELSVLPVNDPPLVSDITNQTTGEDMPVSAIPFTIGDIETSASDLVVTAFSSDSTLLPPNSFTLEGTGANRWLVITPAANQFGVAAVIVSVTDGETTGFDSFALTVTPVNDVPTLTPIADASIPEGSTLGPIPFTIADEETPADNLLVSLSSSNPSLLSISNIVLGGIGANRSITLTPAPHEFGSSVISVSVRDPEGAATTNSFTITVTAVDDPPSISALADQSMTEDSVAMVSFEVSDFESPADALLLVAQSSNSSLLPDSALLFSGSGSNRLLRFAPAANQFGATTITISATDTNGGTSSDSFVLTVLAVNDAPAVANVADQFTDEDAEVDVVIVISDIDSAADNLTVTAASLNPDLVPSANITVSGAGENRTISITPGQNQFGSADILLTVHDDDGGLSQTAFRLTVTPSNDPPAISELNDVSGTEDSPIAPLQIVIGDVETAASNLTVMVSSSNSSLLPSANVFISGSHSNRTLTLSPVANQVGNSELTVTVYDADGGSAVERFILTVDALNDPPSISPVSDQVIAQDGQISIAVAIFDIETAPANLIVGAVSSNPALVPPGNITWAGIPENRILRLTPAGSATGSVTITITARDESTDTASVSFVLTILQSLEPPAILSQPQSQTVSNGATVAFGVTTSGSAPLTYQWQANGIDLPGANSPTLSLSNVQTSDAGSYQVRVSNAAGSALSEPAALVVTQETPLGALDIADQTTSEDVPLTVAFAIGVPETAPFLITGRSANPSLVSDTNLFISGTGTNRAILIVPSGDQFGAAVITITVSNDMVFLSDSFVLTVSPANDTPTLDPIADFGTVQRAGQQTIVLSGISAGPANESQNVSIAVTNSDASLFTPTIAYTNGSANAFLGFTPPTSPNRSGAAVLTVTASDGGASNNTVVRTFTVYVRSTAATPPTISNIADQTIAEDTTTPVIPFTVGDSVTPVGNLTLAGLSSNPTLVPQSGIAFAGSGANRTITVTPAPNAFGTSTVTVTVADGEFGIATDTFLLAVSSVNDAPSLTAVADQAIDENAVLFPVGFIVSDLDTHPSAIAVTAGSSNPGLLPDANITVQGLGTNRYVTAKPAFNQNGVTTITLTADDGAGGTASRSFTLAVSNRNERPTISDIPNQFIPEKSSVTGVPFTVSDSESDAGALILFASSSNPGLVASENITFGGAGSNRTLDIRPATNAFGTALITVTVRDEGGLAASESFILTVAPANDPPTLDALADLLLNQGAPPQLVALTGISSGSPAEDQQLALSAISSNPDLIPHPPISYASPAANGSLLLSPNPGTNGTALITVTVNDGDLLVSRTFTVIVDGRPAISSIADQVTAEDSVAGPIAFTVFDAETPAAEILLGVTSSNPLLVPPSNASISGVGSNRFVTITPAPNEFGVATIAISATDTNGNSTSESFVIVVSSVNDAPTLAPLADVTLTESAAPQTVPLSGITSGAHNENQELLVTVRSDNPGLFAGIGIQYTSPSMDGSLTFSLAPNASGIGNVVVSVSDRQRSNSIVSRSFSVRASMNPSLAISRAGATLTISFATVVGLSYTLEYADLIDGLWTPLGSAVAGTGNPAALTDTLSGTANRFYRVRTE